VLPDFVPGSTIWGEEFGFEPEGPGGLWLIDPIDGTSNFRFGSPLWGVSIALAVGEHIEMGAIYLPDLDELYMAERGHGAFLNEAPMKPIPPGAIRPEELVTYGDWILRNYLDAELPGKMRLSGAVVIDGAFTASQRFRGLIGLREM